MGEIDSRTVFLYSSIQDIQGTIRAIDNKLAVMFLFLVVPLSFLDKIYSAISSSYGVSSDRDTIIAVFLIFLFVSSWVMAVLYSLTALVGVYNPEQHVEIEGEATTGCYFAPRLYHFNLLTSLWPSTVKSTTSITQHLKTFPIQPDAIDKELVFEQMKLAFIRDLKYYLQRLACIFLGLWLVSGSLLWIVILSKV